MNLLVSSLGHLTHCHGVRLRVCDIGIRSLPWLSGGWCCRFGLDQHRCSTCRTVDGTGSLGTGLCSADDWTSCIKWGVASLLPGTISSSRDIFVEVHPDTLVAAACLPVCGTLSSPYTTRLPLLGVSRRSCCCASNTSSLCLGRAQKGTSDSL